MLSGGNCFLVIQEKSFYELLPGIFSDQDPWTAGFSDNLKVF
jgi:hypothetical protein